MLIKRLLLASALLLFGAVAHAQLPGSSQATYPVRTDGDRCAVSGFFPFAGEDDGQLFAKAAIWFVDNVCPRQLEGFEVLDVKARKLTIALTLGSMPASGLDNVYRCKATISVGDGRLLYYLSDITVEGSSLIFKKTTPLERLQPEKKESHRRTMTDFEAAESALLSKMRAFVDSYTLRPISHWDAIAAAEPVKGMTQDECKLAFGKPRMTLQNGGEEQWMYSTTFTLFFRDGVVSSIVR